MPQLEAIDDLRRRYTQPDLQVITAKFFADGVVEGGTSHLLDPYEPACGKGDTHCGEFLWDQEKTRASLYRSK